MTPEELSRLSTLLDEALDLDEAARESWLASLSGDAAKLAPTLRKLLARQASKETLDLLDRPLHFDIPADATPSAKSFAPGDTVGPYRLLRSLGHGGMGEVWLAERADGTLKRKVALKLPHVSWAPGLAERFAREREILASLEHPNIARLYDAGFDPQGRPYMALEYVEGLPIDEFCKRHALPVEGRLRLLLQVADAVAFAHSRLVIHRDLKPGNILVTDDGQVRLLDFGIAKLMEGDATQETALTKVGGRALTLDYASPEQIRGGPIGTSSDVYTLAVVAFELLAGARPYKLKRQSAAALEDAIAQADAPLASDVAGDAAHRKQLTGDLDAILNKALKKDAAERYPTVDALAQDWRRHLDGQRVYARPDTLAYRALRFARRHRTPLAAGGVAVLAFALSIGVGATAVVILALLLGLGAALWQARQAREQARIAHTEARTAEAVQNFLQGIFRASSGDQADPLKARQRTAKDLLDEGALRIERELDDVPEAKLRVLQTLAEMYSDIGELERSARLRGLCVGVAEARWGKDGAQVPRLLGEWGLALVDGGQSADAKAVLDRADALLEVQAAADEDARIAVDLGLGRYYHFERDGRGLVAAERAVRLLSRRPLSVEWLVAMNNLGSMQGLNGDYVTAAATLAHAIAQAPGIAGAANVIVNVYYDAGMVAERLGDPALSERHLRAAFDHETHSSGTWGVNAATAARVLARALANQGRLKESMDLLAEGRPHIEGWPDSYDKAHTLQMFLVYEALSRRQHGHVERALELAERALTVTPPADDNARAVAIIHVSRSEALMDLGRLADAETALQDMLRLMQERGLVAGDLVFVAAVQGVDLALAHHCPEQAKARWEAFASGKVSSSMSAWVHALRADLALAAGDAAQACTLCGTVLQALEARPLPTWPALLEFRTRRTLGRALLAEDRNDEAIAALEPALRLSQRMHDLQVSPDAASVNVLLATAQHAARAAVRDRPATHS